MNPDIYSIEYARSQRLAERREREQKRAQSRASQPRRRDNVKGHRRMSDIQRARDVLAKWRAGISVPEPWTIWRDLDHQGFTTIGDAASYREIIQTGETDEANPTAHVYVPEDARLIVGTAGNPDLLDAIDNMLRWVTAFNTKYDVSREFGHYTASIAAAIIAADERMSA